MVVCAGIEFACGLSSSWIHGEEECVTGFLLVGAVRNFPDLSSYFNMSKAGKLVIFAEGGS